MCLKGFLVFQLFLAPLTLWLLIFLIFGQSVIGDPKIGLTEKENSALVGPFYKHAEVSRFSGAEEMMGRLEAGKLDMGIVLSPGFDETVRSGGEGNMTIYISGKSPLQRRVQAFVLLQSGVVSLQGREPVVNITPVSGGDADIVPWYYRLLPLVVLIAVMMGGLFIPATSIIDDKQRRTLAALLAAPVSSYEFVLAKMLLGGLVSFLMGLLILLLNRSLGNNAAALLAVLGVVALSASCFGCIIGYVSKDMKSVTTLTQSLMLIMYAPAILNIFPRIPEWVQKLFPTYYFFSPLLKLSDRSFAASDAWEIAALLGVLLLLQAVLFLLVRKRGGFSGR